MKVDDAYGAQAQMHQDVGIDIDREEPRLRPGSALLLFLVLALTTWGLVFLAAWGLRTIF